MVRLQTRMMAVLRGVVFACLRVNVSMSRTPVRNKQTNKQTNKQMLRTSTDQWQLLTPIHLRLRAP